MAARPVIAHLLDTFVIDRFATMQKGLDVPDGKDLVVGQGATIVGGIVGARCVYLAREVVVRGPIEATVDIVVGANTKVQGDLRAGSDVLLLAGAHVRGRVMCGGRARLHDARVEGEVEAGGDLEVHGESWVHGVQVRGRTRTHDVPQQL